MNHILVFARTGTAECTPPLADARWLRRQGRLEPALVQEHAFEGDGHWERLELGGAQLEHHLIIVALSIDLQVLKSRSREKEQVPDTQLGTLPC